MPKEAASHPCESLGRSDYAFKEKGKKSKESL